MNKVRKTQFNSKTSKEKRSNSPVFHAYSEVGYETFSPLPETDEDMLDTKTIYHNRYIPISLPKQIMDARYECAICKKLGSFMCRDCKTCYCCSDHLALDALSNHEHLCAYLRLVHEFETADSLFKNNAHNYSKYISVLQSITHICGVLTQQFVKQGHPTEAFPTAQKVMQYSRIINATDHNYFAANRLLCQIYIQNQELANAKVFLENCQFHVRFRKLELEPEYQRQFGPDRAIDELSRGVDGEKFAATLSQFHELKSDYSQLIFELSGNSDLTQRELVNSELALALYFAILAFGEHSRSALRLWMKRKRFGFPLNNVFADYMDSIIRKIFRDKFMSFYYDLAKSDRIRHESVCVDKFRLFVLHKIDLYSFMQECMDYEDILLNGGQVLSETSKRMIQILMISPNDSVELSTTKLQQELFNEVLQLLTYSDYNLLIDYVDRKK